jgi:hypothetical protein
MASQMSQRLAAYGGGFPVWFWHSPKPDLRRGSHLPRGEHGVRIELELPRDRTLLLDFETWHCVLNHWHLSKSSEEEAEWDRKTNGFAPFGAVLPPHLEAELQSTWDRVFDFELLRSAGMWGPIDRIQGVTEYVLLSEVRSAKSFVAR